MSMFLSPLYLTASAVVIHYEEALFQVYAPLRLAYAVVKVRGGSGELSPPLPFEPPAIV